MDRWINRWMKAQNSLRPCWQTLQSGLWAPFQPFLIWSVCVSECARACTCVCACKSTQASRLNHLWQPAGLLWEMLHRDVQSHTTTVWVCVHMYTCVHVVVYIKWQQISSKRFIKTTITKDKSNCSKLS